MDDEYTVCPHCKEAIKPSIHQYVTPIYKGRLVKIKYYECPLCKKKWEED